MRLPKRVSLERYLAEAHVIVSYNGDLRGVVEDILGIQRRIRLSVPGFQSLAACLPGTPLLATIPTVVASELLRMSPELRTTELPFRFEGPPVPMELLWRSARDDDPALRFVRERIATIAEQRDKRR